MTIPVFRLQPWYPGQMGVPGSDNSLGLRTTPQGNVYYVDSTHADASNAHDGTDPNHPKATLASAIAACTANRGDQIIVGSNHAESIATAGAITINRAGVRITGYGNGEDRPTITFTNAVASVIVSAGNITLENLLFVCGADSIAIMLDINADDCHVIGCEFRENTAVAQQFLTAIDINGGGANAADRAKITGCKFVSEAPGATQAIEIGAVEDGIEIGGNFITGDYSVAGIHSGSVLTNLLLAGNYIRNVNAGDFAVELSAAATGMAVGNRFHADALATCFDPGSLMCLDNLATDAIDQSGVPIPATAGGPLPAGSIDAATFAAGAIDAAAIANGAIDGPTFALSAGEMTTDGVIVTRATAALPQTASAALFTVTGLVLLKRIVGYVTVQIGAVANATKLKIVSTGAGADTDICGALDINGYVIDSRFEITGTFANAMVRTIDLPLAKVQVTEIVIPPGTIQVECAGSDGGAGRVRWSATYVPLESGAQVVAA